MAARRRRQGSAVARSIPGKSSRDNADSGADAEARRQSLLVREHESERDVLRFISETADLKEWK